MHVHFATPKNIIPSKNGMFAPDILPQDSPVSPRIIATKIAGVLLTIIDNGFIFFWGTLEIEMLQIAPESAADNAYIIPVTDVCVDESNINAGFVVKITPIMKLVTKKEVFKEHLSEFGRIGEMTETKTGVLLVNVMSSPSDRSGAA